MSKFTSWSPSRLADYDQCPAMANWKHLEKLCPMCFKGRVTGGFDGVPVTCDTCGGKITKSEALERGTRIGEDMEKYLKGEVMLPPQEVASKVARDIAATIRKAVKNAKARIEFMVVLDKDWKPTTNYSKSAWLRAKMDAAWFRPRNKLHVIDWKTGGVDKNTLAPRVDPKYDDQLSIYTTAGLSAFQGVQEATAALVFLDAAQDPVVSRGSATLKREDLAKAQERWNKRLLPMLNDDIYAPCPTNKCRWCDYSNAKGGPCRF